MQPIERRGQKKLLMSSSCTYVAVSQTLALVALLALAPIDALSGSRPDPLPPVLSWSSCGEDFPGLECATATVPLDYDRPFGATTTLALARVPAADAARRIGTVFLNPGGPGGSGVDLVLFGFGAFLAEALQGRFDVVGFDPRGVGASDPLHCFDSEEELNTYFAEAPFFPYRRAQERPFYELYRGLADECFGQKERIIRHMSTADVVRDLDLLRQAVGDRRLTYLGFSYGSFIGNTYANLFPHKVRALAIDGVLDPRLWANSLQIVSDRLATAEEFEEFLRLCDEAADDCALWRPGGSAARYWALAAALRRAPLDLGDFLYTYDFLVADTTSAMYAPELWGGPDGYAALFDALASAVLDSAGAQAARSMRRTIQERLEQARPVRADYDNGFDAFYGNHCADAEYPVSFAAYRAVGEFAEAGSIFGPLWWWSNAACAHWPTSPDRYAGPWSTRTSALVLVVGNFFDGVTDYAGAVASSRLLKNSRLLSYAGWGHTAFGRSDCVTEYVIAYLLEGSLPPQGTVCPANPNPFLSALLRQAAPHAPLIGLPPPRPTR
jgi:pimeloyl-ACP methyl ester carboxylesterase